jgi:8-amino-7-oxononanoate synthase
MPSLRDFAREQLAQVEQRSLTRHVTETERLGGTRVRRGPKEYVSFSCNDYLGLTHHPKVIDAARAALERYGTGAGASRLVTGSHPAYADLEQLLAEMKGTERSLVFSSGYMANVGVIPALVGKDDLIVADRLCHACMWDGARLSGATVMRFDHNDLDGCQDILEAYRGGFGRCLILTESVFSMDGDRGVVLGLSAVASANRAWLMTDDAHDLVMNLPFGADVKMGTLSKAVGSCGGYVCGPSELIEWLANRARSLMFSTGLPPASVAAATAALHIIRDDAELCRKPVDNARRFTDALGRQPAVSAIVPVIVGEPERALAASAMLQEHGLLVVAIRPPSVPPGTARLRFAFSALHEAEPIERAAELLKKHGYA